ncbi:hypothetical protein [Mycobacterium sp. SMC-4]|uniref:hypothetical protein n=1 Tax=Mycobacterium sp. SMC-4 TaxID=2857059 RepID=UPI0021B25DAC|nr:hypothetical protein [Mycobacterium sp. SMC-4]UXA17590.1 hypothetical protein KXD98_23200 [Mycobacterium sp. SMC-4]
MIVTGALLAESASVVDNKLNVAGGVVDRYQIGPDRMVPVTLVVLTKPQPFDKAPSVDLTITDPSGASRAVKIDVPESSLGGEIGFFCLPLSFPAPISGRYVLTVRSQSSVIDLPLNVID